MHEVKIKNGYLNIAAIMLLVGAMSFFPYILEIMAKLKNSEVVNYSYFSTTPYGLRVLSAVGFALFAALFVVYLSKAKLFKSIISKDAIHSYRLTGKLWTDYRDNMLLEGNGAMIFLAIGLGMLIILIGTVSIFAADSSDDMFTFFGILFAVAISIFSAAFIRSHSEKNKFMTGEGVIFISPKAVIINNDMTIFSCGMLSEKLISANTILKKGVNYLKIEFFYKDFRRHANKGRINSEIILPFEKSNLTLFQSIAEKINKQEFDENTPSNFAEQDLIFSKQSKLSTKLILALILSILIQIAIAYLLI